jgi:hypothetical protein
MARIFLNYRTVADAYAAAAISACLANQFGRECVFRDCDSMRPGAIYPADIRAALEQCVTLLAVIGPHWLDATDHAGRRCIDNPQDWVRLELRRGLERRIPVIPVLLDNTVLPGPDQLPPDIRNVSLSQSWQIRHRSLDADVRQLAERVNLLDPSTPPRPSKDNTPTTTWRQESNPTNGGVVYANQGGTQNINRRESDDQQRRI